MVRVSNLDEDGRGGEDEGPGPDEGQDALGLSNGTDGLGLQRVNNRVTSEEEQIEGG